MGAIIAAWTVFGTVKYTSNAAWRIPVGLQAAIPAIQLALVFCLAESPRWLCLQDRPDEAFRILVNVSCYDPISRGWRARRSTMQTATGQTILWSQNFKKSRRLSASNNSARKWMDWVFENPRQPKTTSADQFGLFLLPMLRQRPRIILSLRYPKFCWHHSFVRSIPHQWRTPDLVILGCNILLALCW